MMCKTQKINPEREYLTYLLVSVVGFALLSFSVYTPDFGLLFCTVGCFLTVFGCLNILFTIPLKVEVQKKLEELQKLHDDQKGAAWLIAAGIATLIVAPLLWYMCMYPTKMVIEWVQANMTFANNQLQAINFSLWFLDFMLAFVIFGIIFSVLVNSNWRNTEYNQ